MCTQYAKNLFIQISCTFIYFGGLYACFVTVCGELTVGNASRNDPCIAVAKLVVDERGLVVLWVILFAIGPTYRQLNGVEAGEVQLPGVV